MDQQQLSATYGRELAEASITYNVTNEAMRLVCTAVSPFPVGLEPPFSRFDPGLTFGIKQQPVPSRVSRESWIAKRVLQPVADRLDLSRAASALTGLTSAGGPISWELFADRDHAMVYLGSAPDRFPSVRAGWLASYPESAVVGCPDPWQSMKSDGVFVLDACSDGPYHCAIHLPATGWAHLLELCSQLAEGEAIVVQLLCQATTHPWQSNMAGLAEAGRLLGRRAPFRVLTPKKLTEPMVVVALRVATTAEAMVPSILAFLRTFIANGQPFRVRTTEDFLRVLTPEDLWLMLRDRVVHTPGQLFGESELARLVHPLEPMSQMRLDFVTGLPVPAGFHGPGLLVGTNTSRGEPINVFQPLDQPAKSCYVEGRSRAGKTVWLTHRIRSLAAAGWGMMVLDPHRTLAFELPGLLGDIAPERVIVLDFDDPKPVAINFFADHDPSEHGRLTLDYVNALKHLFDASGYHRMTHFLAMGINACLVTQQNLATLPRFFARSPEGEQLRRYVASNATNAAVRRFWQDEFPTHSSEAAAPITNRLSALLLDDATHRTFSQSENRINMAQIIDNGTILIVAPPASPDAASIVGGLLIAEVKNAASKRVGTERAKNTFQIVADEASHFIRSAATIQQIVNETEKAGLSLLFAHQESGQLPSDFATTLGSMPNTFVFGVNISDARNLARLFNGQVTAETLAMQTTGECHARIGQEIVNFRCPPPAWTYDRAGAQRILARSKDGYHVTPTVDALPRRRAPRNIDTLLEE